jgi:menaquinol-cytochrome c reductase iron-sulfur subunit
MNAIDRPPTESLAEPPRRDFLWSFGALIVGAATGLVGLVSGAWVFLDPLLRRPQKPLSFREEKPGIKPGYVRVATLEAVPEDGVPRRYPVIADRIDAWNFMPSQPVGTVYMRRETGQDLQVFHSTCPHAGCSVSTVESSEGSSFHCPCHNSSFDATGKREARPGKKNPSPRDLDQLEYQIVDGAIWVEFKDFYTGRPEKVAKL